MVVAFFYEIYYGSIFKILQDVCVDEIDVTLGFSKKFAPIETRLFCVPFTKYVR